MALKNCWEIKKCGREKGGAREVELGSCPACPDRGHSCWIIAGTLCGGEIQGTFAQRDMDCLKCEVYKLYNIRTGTERERLIDEYKHELAKYLNGDVDSFTGKTNQEALAVAAGEFEEKLEAQLQARTQELLAINRQLQEEIKERKRAEKTIRHMAHYDALTNLPNRVMLEDRLKAEISRAGRGNDSLAVFFIDLDRFKTINDTQGHPVGDLLLQSVAERLRKCMREYDVLARFGGDEFVAVLPKIHNPQHISMLAKRIIEALKTPFTLNFQKIYVTTSIGIAVYPGDAEDHDTLVKQADIAMSRAKDLGRDNFQFYEPEMNRKLMEFAKLESALAEALERRELRLEYQPQIDISNHELIGVEALIRWDHPEHGLVPPMDFIPMAEETGLIIPIGEWVVRTACRQNVAWQDAGYPPVRIAVNLSARQFRQKILQEMVIDVLDETGLEPRWLDLEITESQIVKDTATAVTALRDLRARGVNVSLDDFGEDPAGERGQDRSQLHKESAHERMRRGNCTSDNLAGPQLETEGHCRRRRDRGSAQTVEPPQLRYVSGVSVQPAGQTRDHGRCAFKHQRGKANPVVARGAVCGPRYAGHQLSGARASASEDRIQSRRWRREQLDSSS
jgi:diguanylate cyclase (GGDEF)-like protein